jgi:hypothetical protein
MSAIIYAIGCGDGRRRSVLRTCPVLYRAWSGERIGQLNDLAFTRLTSAIQASLDL